MAPKKSPPPVTVDESEVGDTVQSFIENDNVESLTVEKQADGSFKVSPTAP